MGLPRVAGFRFSSVAHFAGVPLKYLLDIFATAENISPVSSISSTASFTITSETTLFAQSNYVFNNLGGQGTQFDWGLPFFLGKKIAVCIDGATCGSSTGPLWAY